MVKFKRERIVFFVVVIYGDGELIDNVVWFYKWLVDFSEDNDFKLKGMKFGVFGFGNC